jgi:glycosyltransferase involved in cell wall biosynthesis
LEQGSALFPQKRRSFMSKKLPCRILQVSTADSGGGAEGSAWELCQYFRNQGLDSWLAVGRKYRQAEEVFELPRPPSAFLAGRALQTLAAACRRHELRAPALRRLSRICERLADPPRLREWWQGFEEFHYPGTSSLLDACPGTADIVHCHNLHGYYFDLGFLPELSGQTPVILNLHDAWLLTGHCSHFFDCQAWRQGCGNCPYLDTYPACRKDRSAENWRRKADIYQRSRLYVTAPSRWLLELAEKSMLKALEYRLIPNSIDCSVFKPGSRHEARAKLQLPQDRPIVLFCAATKKSVFKDPVTMVETMLRVAAQKPDVFFVCIGSKAALPALRRLPLLSLPYLRQPSLLADYYRAADVFVHTAKAETFGKTITEAMACATAVAATRIGGIPEQMIEGQTGIMAAAGNAAEMSAAVLHILDLPPAEKSRMDQAAAVQGAKYPLQRQGELLLQWYQEIIGRRQAELNRAP